jgi:hypothetical protein
MKKVVIVALLAFLLINAESVNAQAFGGKGSKQISISLGMANHSTWFSHNNHGVSGRFSPLSGVVSVQGEFGIHKYVGIGFDAGFNFSNSLWGFYGAKHGKYYYGYDDDWDGYNGWGGGAYRGFGIPISFIANFHFLQLIADKTGKSFADKLDVYGGLSFGSGPFFAILKNGYKNYNGNDIGAMLIAGPHVGIRYYPKGNVGIHAEVGYGKSIINGGVTFKM